jgi:hypothetical protein
MTTNNFLVFHYTIDYENEPALEIIMIDMNPHNFMFNKNAKEDFTITPIANLYSEDAVLMILKGMKPSNIKHIIKYVKKYKDVEIPEHYNTYVITTDFTNSNFLLKENALMDESIAN